MKKKYIVPSKEKKEWIDFTRNIGELSPKESDLLKEQKNISKLPKLDLHGNTLDEANQKIKEFIKNEDELKKIIMNISDADPKDGGTGAIYISLKNKNKIKE